MIETIAGLPNSCSKCGTMIDGTWFAEHEDAARSGLGVCGACSGVKPAVEAEKIDEGKGEEAKKPNAKSR